MLLVRAKIECAVLLCGLAGMPRQAATRIRRGSLPFTISAGHERGRAPPCLQADCAWWGGQVALNIGSPLPRVAEPEDALQVRLLPAL